MYDLIIIGAGCAGLTIGIESLKLSKKLKVLILEKYDYIGGRVLTYHKDKLQWEIGAGRISKHHSLVRKLIDKYNLTWYDFPDSDDSEFSKLIEIYIRPLFDLSASTLSNSTLFDLLFKIHGPKIHDFIIQFPYWTEMYRLRADIALESFSNEMKSMNGFGSCKEGLSAITDNMASEFQKLGGEIVLSSEVNNIIDNNIYTKSGKIFTAKTIVLALHHQAISKIDSLKSWYLLNYVTMEPLVRIYAVFPTKNKKSWFSDLPKIVTSSHLRFVIPINPENGSIMISYTDGKDARYWIKLLKEKGKDAVQNEIMKLVRSEFGNDIPDPVDFHVYPWYDGCSYWLPGSYNPKIESENSHIINDNLFQCGESWSLRQAWIEGALEHSHSLLKNKSFLKQILS
jgi:hypothetical protein